MNIEIVDLSNVPKCFIEKLEKHKQRCELTAEGNPITSMREEYANAVAARILGNIIEEIKKEFHI